MKTLIPFLLAFAISLTVCAQDAHFSQFYANRIYLNPAYAGFDPGTTLTLNYRDQWFGVPDGDISTFANSYRTFNATANFQIPCFLQLEDINSGVAFSVFRDEAGRAPLVTQGSSVGFSHEIPLTRPNNKNRFDLRLGFQSGFMQRSLRSNFLIYSDQLDPVWGLQGNEPLTLDLQSRWFPVINAGVMIRGFSRKRKAKKKSLSQGFPYTIGASFSNVNQPNESLLGVGGEVTLPMRFTFHLGFAFEAVSLRGVQAPMVVAPQFRWDRQSELNLQTLGAYVFTKAYYGGLFFQYNLAPGNPDGTLGGSIRSAGNTRTLILNAGLDIRSMLDNGVPWRKRKSGLILGLAYDINLSGLNSATTLGVFELNLRVNFWDNKRRNCGELGKFEYFDGKCPVRF